MGRKYDHLFYEFEPQETNWGDWCHSPQAYFRGDKDMPGAQLNVGYQVFKKPVYLEREPHFHREEEYLVFFGAKLPDVFSSFDADIDFYIGPSLDAMEKITISKPTIIRIPPGMWHSPLDFRRMGKPVLFQAISLSGKFGSIKARKDANGHFNYIYAGEEVGHSCSLDPSKKCTYCGSCFKKATEGKVTSEELFSKPGPDFDQYWTVKDTPLSDEIKYLICEVPPEDTKWGPWCPTPQAYFRGETYMPGANYHVGFQVFTGPNDMEEAHFHQGVEEYIFFMGADPMNIFDFDAEIHFSIGDDPDNLEVYKITKPTVVRLPPTMWHSPILFRNVNKPLLFQVAFLAGCWGTIVRRLDENGNASYIYNGDNVRFCRVRPGERCNICGQCFKQRDLSELTPV